MIYKILSLILLISIFTGYVLPMSAFANDSSYEYAREALEQTPKWNSYITSIDTALSMVSDTKLKDIKIRASTALDTNAITSKNTVILLEYIEAAVELEILNRLWEINLSEADKAIAEKEILIMQNHLWDNLNTMMKDLIADWNTLTRYKETWDMNMSIKANMPNILSMEMWVNISDYTNENQSLDSRFQGKIDGFIDIMTGWENVSVSGESIADIISKDGAIYALIQDLKIEGNSIDDSLNIYIRKLQELAENNTYLTSHDTDLDELSTLVSAFSPTKMEQQIETMQNTPLLEAYQKIDDSRYILRPTQEFCSYAKELLSVFDPFGWKDCSEAQYKDFLQDYHSENPNMILSLWNTSILSLWVEDDWTEMNMDFSWNKNEMKSMSFNAKNTSFWKSEYMTIDWEMWTSLMMDMNIEDITWKLSMKLSNNGISSFDANFWYDNPYSDGTIDMLITYKNSTLDVDVTFVEYTTTMDCSISGLLKSHTVDLAWNCSVSDTSIAYLGTWSETMDISSSLKYDGVWNRNNTDFIFSIVSWEAFFDITLKNTGKRSITTQREILAPENTKNIEEFQDEIFDELYEDLY